MGEETDTSWRLLGSEVKQKEESRAFPKFLYFVGDWWEEVGRQSKRRVKRRRSLLDRPSLWCLREN